MDIGGGKIKRHTLLAILIVFGIALISLSAVSATDPDPIATNDTTSDNTTLNDTSNSTDNQTQSNVSKAAAGDPPVMKGYWMFSQDVASASASDLKTKGITDIFVLTRGVTGVYHYSELQAAINKFHPYGIKVHAWFVCFKDDGYFVDPSGYYKYTVKIYVKTTKYWGTKKVAYKVKKRTKYKSWYKYRGKWKYKWKYKYRYVTKYKYVKGWIYTPVYRYETRTGYDLAYNTKLINEIANINNKYNIDGIHLDYVRYSGVASVGHAAWQQPGGTTAAVNTITGFIESVSKVVTKQLSAALMPEGDINDDYYAQDYDRLADYLDFLVPMTYEGNYNKNNTWITERIQYIVDHAVDANGNKKPVYAGLTTYCSDSNLRALSLCELQDDVNSAQAGGASGFVLFRYGFGCSSVPNWT